MVWHFGSLTVYEPRIDCEQSLCFFGIGEGSARFAIARLARRSQSRNRNSALKFRAFHVVTGTVFSSGSDFPEP